MADLTGPAPPDKKSRPAGNRAAKVGETEAMVSPATDSPRPYDVPADAPITFWHVDIRPWRRVVHAVVLHPDGTRHEVGHLPSEGWFCGCRRGKRCKLIADVQQLLPELGGG